MYKDTLNSFFVKSNFDAKTVWIQATGLAIMKITSKKVVIPMLKVNAILTRIAKRLLLVLEQ